MLYIGESQNVVTTPTHVILLRNTFIIIIPVYIDSQSWVLHNRNYCIVCIHTVLLINSKVISNLRIILILSMLRIKKLYKQLITFLFLVTNCPPIIKKKKKKISPHTFNLGFFFFFFLLCHYVSSVYSISLSPFMLQKYLQNQFSSLHLST